MARKRTKTEIWLESAKSTDITRERILEPWTEGRRIIATDGHRLHELNLAQLCGQMPPTKKYIGHPEHPTQTDEIFESALKNAKNVWTGAAAELRGILYNIIDVSFVNEIDKLQKTFNEELELLKIAPLNAKYKGSLDETIHCMSTLVKEKNNRNLHINIEQVTGFYIRFCARYLLEALHNVEQKVNLHIIPTDKFENPLVIEIDNWGRAIVMPVRG